MACETTYVFYVFYVFSKSKKRDFLRFFEWLTTFSRTLMPTLVGHCMGISVRMTPTHVVCLRICLSVSVKWRSCQSAQRINFSGRTRDTFSRLQAFPPRPIASHWSRVIDRRISSVLDDVVSADLARNSFAEDVSTSRFSLSPVSVSHYPKQFRCRVDLVM